MEAEIRFPAMGSDAHVMIVGGSLALLDVARRYVEELEGRWSRFRPTSEISRMNDQAGRPVRVSADTLALVQRAVEGARRTEGQYDPTVLGAMLRAGYDRSFEFLSERSRGLPSELAFGYEGIAIDHAASSITLPPGVGFDPGGIGKGFAADLVVETLTAGGALGACANLGGDLRVVGESPGGDGWVVGIDHPSRGEPAATVALREGAVATSTQTRRTWGPQGASRHHLIDPATGRPAGVDVLSATAIAAEGWQAEVVAKAAFLGGVGRGLATIEALGADGMVVGSDGEVHSSRGFERFLAGPGSGLQEVLR
jgi:thiamine biosynthesis lipoprotein